MRIATWNVNSVKQRIENLTAWLAERAPDIVCLQETKTVDEAFPARAVRGAWLQCCSARAENLQRRGDPVQIQVRRGHPRGCRATDADDHARFIEATVSTKAGMLRVASIYLPNGNPAGTEKYSYKIRWMDRLLKYAHERLQLEEPLIMAGDYNVIPTADDVHNPGGLDHRRAVPAADPGEVPQPSTNLGLTDAIRAVSDEPGLYTFWDYQAGAWQKNWGIRIDHLLLSPQAADRLVTAGIDKHVRSWERPSDHVPVYVDLDIEAA